MKHRRPRPPPGSATPTTRLRPQAVILPGLVATLVATACQPVGDSVRLDDARDGAVAGDEIPVESVVVVESDADTVLLFVRSQPAAWTLLSSRGDTAVSLVRGENGDGPVLIERPPVSKRGLAWVLDRTRLSDGDQILDGSQLRELSVRIEAVDKDSCRCRGGRSALIGRNLRIDAGGSCPLETPSVAAKLLWGSEEDFRHATTGCRVWLARQSS